MSEKRWTIIYAVAAFLLILVLHHRELGSWFVGDDFDMINSFYDKEPSYFLKLFVRDYQPPQWATLHKKVFGQKSTGMIRPFVIISYKIEYMLSGVHPIAYRLSNFLLLFLSSLLVYLIINHLTDYSDRWLGFVGGLLYAVNPVLFQWIGWMSSKGDVLSAFFYLLTFYLFIKYRSTGSRRYYFWSLVSLFFGLFSKESMAVMPLIIICYDVFRGFKLEVSEFRINSNILTILKRYLLTWLPYLILLAGYLAVRKISLGSFVGGYGKIHFSLTLGARVKNLIFYIYYIFFAVPYDENAMFRILTKYQAVQVAIVFVIFYLPLLVFSLKYFNWRLFNFGVLWFAVGYIPAFSYPSASPWVVYIPTVGAVFMMTALLFSMPWRKVSLAASLVLILFHGLIQFNHNSTYKTAGHLTQHIKESVEKEAKNFREGGTIIVIGVPDHYKSCWVYPVDSNLTSALSRPFSSVDLTDHFNVIRASLTPYTILPHPLLKDVMKSLDPETSGDVHILRWDERSEKFDRIDVPFFIKDLARADVEAKHLDSVRVEFCNINNDSRLTLYQQPTSKITYYLKVPDHSYLSFAIALAPAAWTEEKGEGVGFKILARNGKSEEVLFSKYIDPKNKEADRRWHDQQIDLTRFAGKDIALSFVTASKLEDYGLAGWGEPRLISRADY